MAMDTAAHVDHLGKNIGRIRLIRVAGTVGVHHREIIAASAARYPASIAFAADFVGVRSTVQVVPVSHAGHEVAPIRLITEVI